MNKIKFQNDTYTLPESWNEMNPKQLEQIAKIVMSNVYPIGLMVKLSLSFMGMRLSGKKPVYINGGQYFYVKHGWRRIYLINSVQMHEICKCVEFLLDDNQIISSLTKNPYPVIENRFYRLFGPADNLANIRFGEFIQVEIERDAFVKTNDKKHFNRMLAILWRPTCWKNQDSDMRIALRMDRVDKWAKRIAKLPDCQKRVMQWYYDGCLQFLKEKFSSVFSSGSSDENVSTFDSFMKMVNLLAHNRLIDVEKIREAYLFDALYTLQEIIENFENQKR